MVQLDASSEDFSPLCCCEYYDRHNQRYHILGCCCNCVAFDEACDRFICCRQVPNNVKREMLLTFQDRLRIPCRGGAKQVSLGAIVPIFAIPIVLGLSALNLYTLVILNVTTLFSTGYFFVRIRRTNTRTKLFFVWILASVVYLLVLFEFTVPLLEILPEENGLLFLLVTLSLYCIYKVKRLSRDSILVPQDPEKDISNSNGTEATTVLIENEESDDSDRLTNRQMHNCAVCQAVTTGFDHHSFVLDCCISKSNHKYYFFGLLFGICALLLGSNLTLTSVCHPFLLFRIAGVHVLLPDDCTEVFDQYEMGLSFVLSLYSLVIAALATTEFTIQVYAISKGISLNDWKKGRKTGNRKSICMNWRSFLC
ncbi:unnamed protein product [Hermetia illucens]|uniref:Palmitoyltransferase n=2 Tax=Hermetia illucens TaxID=343691 RepID=A0A7R8YP80_HERIL|nr:palmitoyltransferase ZDHHC23 isoform X1 [Hermetia illucens]XP_037923864.1 palmitoyltransferase ZDHHC23 isoform X1 [Hermetia illucens]CAD7080041.1 unnamed protein product [Hermetia illucens]